MKRRPLKNNIYYYEQYSLNLVLINSEWADKDNDHMIESFSLQFFSSFVYYYVLINLKLYQCYITITFKKW